MGLRGTVFADILRDTSFQLEGKLPLAWSHAARVEHDVLDDATSNRHVIKLRLWASC